MTTNDKRYIATSLTSTIFLVIGITGVMMYFHILDAFTKNMHEILGLVFVGAVVFHVFFHWHSMKKYFTKKVFLSSLLVVFIVVSGFIYNSSNAGVNPKQSVIEAVLKAPIKESIRILGSNMQSVESKFKNSDIKFEKEVSILEIAQSNNTSPFRIVAIIVAE